MTDLNAAIECCHRHGYSVSLPISEPAYETVAAYCLRLGISKTHFWRRTRDPRCPGFLARRGTAKIRRARIKALRSNPALEKWLEKRI